MDDALHQARPKITVLTRDQVQAVHQRSLDILSLVGIRVDSSRAGAVFENVSGIVRQDDLVRFSPEIIDWALSVAPGEISVYDRAGNQAFHLGSSEARETAFGIGVTNLFYQEAETDEVRPFLRQDMVQGVRLGDSLSQFSLISTLGIPRDLPEYAADLYSGLDMLANTKKPLVLLVSKDDAFEPLLDLFEHLQGDLGSKPFILPYFNPITPLVLNEGTALKIMAAVQRRLPFIYNNYGMSGASTPITPFGTLALLNAELLAGLVFSQLLRQGTSVILGSLPAGFDMRSMISTYTPQTMLLNLACAEMMDFYRLPHSGTSGSCNGWGPDLSAAGTLWMNHLSSCLGKVGLAPFVGGNFDSMTFSPATVVYANEIIRQARSFARGFFFAEQKQDIEDIRRAGPGGDFLYSERTFALCRELDEGLPLWPNLSLEAWQEKGSPAAGSWLRARTGELLARARGPEDRAEITARGEAYLKDRHPGL
ncbi:MAG: trimethylamine methyltransferase family protein [Thermodesulfobacteriota bacterium]